MDKGTSYTDINLPVTMYENYIEDRMEQELVIPDYHASARKIVHAEANACVLNKSISEDTVTLEGLCIWKLLYLSEEDQLLHTISLEKPFTETFSASAGEGAVRYKIKCKNVLCKLQSPQKATCKAVLCVALQISGIQPKKILARSADDEMQMLSETSCAMEQIGTLDKEFKATGEIPLQKNDEHTVYKVGSDVCVQEVKCLEDKVIVKGVCKNYVILLSQQSCHARRLESEVPFSQILDIPGTTENCKCFVQLCVNETDTSMIGETDNTSILVNVVISASAVVYCPKDIELYMDCYHPIYETETTNEHLEYYRNIVNTEASARISQRVHMLTRDIEVLYHEADCDIEKISAHDNNLVIDGKVTVSLTYKLADEILHSSFSLPFQTTREMDSEFDKLKCEADIRVENFGYIILNENEIEISCDCRIPMTVFVMGTGDVLTDVKVTDNKRQQLLKTPLILYFASEGESVWDIGKKYCVPIDVLMTTNELGGSRLDEDKLIYISKH